MQLPPLHAPPVCPIRVPCSCSVSIVVPGLVGSHQAEGCQRFSVASGAGLTRRRELSFVTGAPRANHTGAVVILRRDSANRLVPEAVVPGPQLSSAFGHSVAVLDLNSDG
uniref:Uncharacterized protein n=1 Tax=Amazona collaria TaxID=241587 RepID=A0A8B9G776_9PSIT